MRCVALAILLLGGAALAHAADEALVGAAAVLAKQAPACPPSGCANDDVFDTASARAGLPPALRARIDALAAEVAAYHGKPIGGADAAARWTALLERWIALARETRERGPFILTTSGDDLFRVLPAPSTWRGIAAALRAKHPEVAGKPADAESFAVQALAAKLSGDDAALRALVAKARAASGSSPADARHVTDPLSFLALTIDNHSGADPVERFIASSGSEFEGSTLRVPDLVTLAGDARATELLTRALTQSKATLSIEVGDATRALAAKLALQNIDKLAAPQWELVRGLDCIALYEAMNKRFGTGTGRVGVGTIVMAMVFGNAGAMPEPMGRDHATLFYLAALVAKGRTADAEKVAEGLHDTYGEHEVRDVLDALDSAGETNAVFTFLDAFVAHHAASDLWPTYLDVAARVHKQDAVLARLRESMASPEGASQVGTLRPRLIDALLSADKVDEAVAEIDRLLDDPATTQATRASYALKLAKVGRLLDRPAWIERGLGVDAAIRKQAGTSRSSRFYMGLDIGEERGRLLRRLHRYAEAERVAAAGIADDGSRDSLVELAGIYHDANRPADVIYLLDHAHGWGAGDLVEIAGDSDSLGIPLGYLAAQALHETHRDAQALRALEAVIDAHGGYDPAYALYIQIKGPAAIADLDRLYRHDQFEERPLIWKATLLLQAKRYQEAEAAARDAIAVDPSDGEEPAGDRLRGYVVLADVLDARKAPGDEAATYRNAVAAIRESEHADQFRLAGLHARAVSMYSHALESFSDAYCIQSRLAVELNERGDTLLAAEHYRRAYELMPTSFGRMESHCLGCENVFGGVTAQGIAQQVFTHLVQSMPGNPRVHYLLGYLRETEQRYAEAYAQYSAATDLDADYLNAWNHLFELHSRIDMGRDATDRVVLRLLALDPRQRHVHTTSMASEVADWAALYTVVDKAWHDLPAVPSAVYALAGRKSPALSRAMHMVRWQLFGPVDVDTSGGAAIGSTTLARAILTGLNPNELSRGFD